MSLESKHCETLYGLLSNYRLLQTLNLHGRLARSVPENRDNQRLLLIDFWPAGPDFFVRFSLDGRVYTASILNSDGKSNVTDVDEEPEVDWSEISSLAARLTTEPGFSWFLSLFKIYTTKNNELKALLGGEFEVAYSTQRSDFVGFHLNWLASEITKARGTNE